MSWVAAHTIDSRIAPPVPWGSDAKAPADGEETRPVAIVGIFHPVISVADMGRSLRFYAEALGLRVTFDDYHDPAAISALFGFDSPRVRSVVVQCPDRSEIELVEYEQPRGRARSERAANDAGILAVNLRVTDIGPLVERILAGGYEVPSGIVDQTLPDGGVIRVAVTIGPEGETIILVELPEGRASLGG
jgi:catechol 2,3-dioxygenase-like lactoylglutathione lyase family enzyme